MSPGKPHLLVLDAGPWSLDARLGRGDTSTG
jgi:hypothetical protein